MRYPLITFLDFFLKDRMPNSKKHKSPPTATIPSTTADPLVFISHDSRDAELAEAFGKLLKSVSSGMIKIFLSSDNKGTDGIDFGADWYKRLMEKLRTTSDVVCLFTGRSLDRPWILFEAGVAKGRESIPVMGIALGVPLSRVTSSPFYQFQNTDDSPEKLSKLVRQLADRVPKLELDSDVVKQQIEAFKKTEDELLAKLSNNTSKNATKEELEERPIAILVEEMKALPLRVAQSLSESDFNRRRKHRHFHPMMMEELMHMSGENGSADGILMAASLVRDDAPWLYELAMEVYRALRSGDTEAIRNEISRIHHFTRFAMHDPFMEEFAFGDKHTHMMVMEFPRMLEHIAERSIHEVKTQKPRLGSRVSKEK